MTGTEQTKYQVIEERCYSRPFRVVDQLGEIAIGKYGYKGHLQPIRYATREAALKAIKRLEKGDPHG
jgi:hypothetical protein